MKKKKKIKKLVVIESKDEEKLLSFLNVLEAVADDMGLKVTDGDMHYSIGADY